MAVILGTAGHIDHGKTSLVRALTGIDCDRLEEEKKRGITIELGFAFLDLPGGERLGIVDVPGHEKFVKNMVSGAAGIDMVMLVVAADEGVMPQTREHLEICSLLGTKVGLVALTKTDMVDEEMIELAMEDVQEFLQGTFLEDAPIVPVSSQTKEGLDGLRELLAKMVGEYKEKRRTDLVRLPIDRIFTMRGYGTVVTGTLVSGKINVGDEIQIYPTDRKTKVRTLQSHGASVETAPAGRRTAVNLQGVEVEDLMRGEVLAKPGTLFPSTVWDVEFQLVTSARIPLKHRKEVHFHHGSREILGKVYFLDRDQLEPGETAICQVRFNEPMVGVHGDRVVVRSHAPLRTIGGGRLLNPLGRKVKRFSDDVKRLEGLTSDDPETVVLTQLAMAGGEGLTFNQLLILSNLETKALEKLLQQLGGKQLAAIFDKETRAYVSGEYVETMTAGLLEWMAAFHKTDPMKPGVSRGQLGSDWGKGLHSKLLHFLVERALKRGDIVAGGDVLHLPGHKVSLASDQAKLREALLKAYTDGGYRPPNLKDVLEPLDLTFKEASPVYTLLQEQGELLKIKEDMYYAVSVIEEIKAKILNFFKDNDEMGPADFKGLTDLSRKYAIPVLEYFDKEKITVRVGDVRRLRASQR